MNCCNNSTVCCRFKTKSENGHANIFHVSETLVETSFNNGAGNETIARNGEWYKLLKHLSKYNCPDVYVFQEKKKTHEVTRVLSLSYNILSIFK